MQGREAELGLFVRIATNHRILGSLEGQLRFHRAYNMGLSFYNSYRQRRWRDEPLTITFRNTVAGMHRCRWPYL